MRKISRYFSRKVQHINDGASLRTNLIALQFSLSSSSKKVKGAAIVSMHHFIHDPVGIRTGSQMRDQLKGVLREIC